MSVDRLERAFAGTRAVLADVQPEDYGKPTPCASWTVRDVANHVVEGANWFGLCVNGRGPDGSGAPFGVAVDAPEGASTVERLVSFLGRSA
jgi:uncharacterized protein (TIGR03083 family)